MGTRGGSVEGDQGPDYDEVLQLEDHPIIRVPVDLDLPVHTREVQSASGMTIGKNLVFGATVEAVKVLNEDPRRGATTLIAGNAYYIGFSKADAEGRAAQIPGSTPIQIRHGKSVWACAAVANTYVTAIVELWVH